MSVPCCMQGPNQVIIVMDDGFNVVQYTFHLREAGPGRTSVLCEVRPPSAHTGALCRHECLQLSALWRMTLYFPLPSRLTAALGWEISGAAPQSGWLA